MRKMSVFRENIVQLYNIYIYIRNFSLRHKLHLLLALLYGECDERMRQEIMHATADKRTLARSPVTAYNLALFTKPQ